MNRRVAVSASFAVLALLTASRAAAQRQTLEPGNVEVFNRTASSFKDGTRTGLHLSAGADYGVAYLRGIELGNGTIELDIKGRDVPQQRFVGVAFQGVHDTTYDA